MTRRVRLILGCLFLATGLAPIQAQEPVSESKPAPAVEDITSREIAGHLGFLASDLMRGRDTASPEIKIASEYLAAHLKGAGAEPVGDEIDGKRTYFAHFPLESTTPKTEGTTLTFEIETDGARREIPCTVNSDFLVFPRNLAHGTVEAPVFFAGTPEEGKDLLEGLDVKDHFILVVEPAPPERAEGDRPAPRVRRGSMAMFQLQQAAREKGALGIISMHAFGSENRTYADAMAFVKQAFDRPSTSLGEGEKTVPVLMVEDSVRDELNDVLKLSDAERKPGLVEGLRARFTLEADHEVKQERNVIGLFQGSDPERAKEVVIFSAHYDHVGVGDDGQIFNGSDDNASGTSALLEIAEAFGEGPKPARSVAFLWVSGEEKGLWGSKWFSDHVTLPEGYKIVANINMDMVSRNDPNKVSVTPSANHPDYNTIVPMAEESAKQENMELVFDADQFFGRTDSYNFAAKGIPVIFFFSGLHEDYHRPTDDIEKADTEKAARIARLAYRLGWSVADSPTIPARTNAGDKPETKAEAASGR